MGYSIYWCCYAISDLMALEIIGSMHEKYYRKMGNNSSVPKHKHRIKMK